MNQEIRQRALAAALERYSSFPDLLHASLGWILTYGSVDEKRKAERAWDTMDLDLDDFAVKSYLSARRSDTADCTHSDPRSQVALKASGQMTAQRSTGPKNEK